MESRSGRRGGGEGETIETRLRDLEEENKNLRNKNEEVGNKLEEVGNKNEELGNKMEELMKSLRISGEENRIGQSQKRRHLATEERSSSHNVSSSWTVRHRKSVNDKRRSYCEASTSYTTENCEYLLDMLGCNPKDKYWGRAFGGLSDETLQLLMEMNTSSDEVFNKLFKDSVKLLSEEGAKFLLGAMESIKKQKTEENSMAEKMREMEENYKTNIDAYLSTHADVQRKSEEAKPQVLKFWRFVCSSDKSIIKENAIVFPAGVRFSPGEYVSVGNTTQLVIRPWYRLVVKKIEALDARRPIIIWGSPGVGKSIFGVYLFLYYAAQEISIIYHHIALKGHYIFAFLFDTKNPIVRVFPGHEDIESIGEVMGMGDKFVYIVDGVEPSRCEHKIIMLTSPTGRITKTLSTNWGVSVPDCFVPPWSEQEVIIGVNLLYEKIIQSEASTTDMSWDYFSHIYRHFGGIARRMFQTQSASVQKACEDLTNAMGIIRHDFIMSNHNYLYLDYNESSRRLHMICHLFAKSYDTLDLFTARFASEFVALAMMTRKRQKDEEIKALNLGIFNLLVSAPTKGILYEECQHILLCRGRRERTCYKLDTQPLENSLTIDMREVSTCEFDSLEDVILNNPQNGIYYKPKSKNFPTIDSFFIQQNDIYFFQFTISPVHGVNAGGLLALTDYTKRVGIQKKKPHLIFVIPQENKQRWQTTQKLGGTPEDKKKCEKIFEDLPQYILPLDVVEFEEHSVQYLSPCTYCNNNNVHWDINNVDFRPKQNLHRMDV